MLTVLHIFSGDLWAGAEVVIFNLLNRLKDYPDLKLIALSLNNGILTEKLKDAKIETYIIPEITNSFPMIFLKTLKLLKGRRINIIHSHRYKENFLAFLLTKSIKVKKLITTIHGLPEPPLYGKDRRTHFGWKTKIDYFILKRYFTHVVAVSQEMKRTLIQKYGFKQEKVNVIYNGIEIPRPHPLSQPQSHNNNRFHIGTVGRMVPVKDFNLFLEIATEIKKRIDNVCFSILGDGPLREQLIQRAKELKIEDSVEFISPISDPFSYYKSLDLYLNTSFYEGIPVSILEAMSCGKPVVASKVGGIPEIILDGRNGILVEKRAPKEFARSCFRLIHDKNLRIMIKKNAIQRIEACFSDYKMAESYRSLYY
jgi:glycosyltransferase involved in cell wall biosynthesis